MQKNEFELPSLLPQVLTIDVYKLDGGPLLQNEIFKILGEMRQRNFVHYIILKFIFATGLSLPELTNLRIKEVHLNQGRVSVSQGERLKARTIFLDPGLRDEILRYVHHYQKGEYLFPGRIGQISVRNIQKILEEASRIAGKQVTTTLVRDTIAIHFFKRGFPLWEIQEFLGHRSIQSTKQRICLYKITEESLDPRLFKPNKNKVA